MSNSWRNKYFERLDCKGIAINEGEGDILVTGEVNNDIPNPIVIYWAPNPPTYSTSFTGSSLPYYDSIQAYDRTPNVGSVKCINNKFQFRIKYPNAYYVGLGTLYVPPHLHFKICTDKNIKDDLLNLNVSDLKKELDDKKNLNYHTIKIDDGVPFRTLTHPAPPTEAKRNSPMFYYCSKEQLPVRGQEQVLRDSGYPEENKMPSNFWGLKPPL